MLMFRNRRGLAALLLLALATLPLAADATQAAAQAAPAQAGQPAQPDASLPPAREVIDRHLEAIGGREAVLAHSSSHAIGTIEVPAAGLKGTLEVFAAKPDKSLMRATLTGVGEIQEGYNGTVGWSISAMTGPTLLQGKQLEQRNSSSRIGTTGTVSSSSGSSAPGSSKPASLSSTSTDGDWALARLAVSSSRLSSARSVPTGWRGAS